MADRVRAGLTAKHQAREEALRLSRETIRHCSNAIRAVHRGEFTLAEDFIAQALANLRQVDRALAGHTDIYWAGFVHDAQKEYAEACSTLALVRGEPVPTPEELAVPSPAYLNGLAEAVGELRRHLLDRIRTDDLTRCEEVLRAMDDIYGVLVTMDYPDALTGGLRRSTDVARSIIERTRGDVTMALRQRQLERAVADFTRKIAG
ncbi:MAG: haloacid dehalogenase [Chloroflexi bacterium]|nr:haloacid dehalogenase [Chloroflexota bacterium]